MQRCATCRYWGHHDDRLDPAVAGVSVMRHCRAVLHREDLRDGLDPDVRPEFIEMATVSDSSGYMATFYTRADFGCVLHEPGDSTQPPATPSEQD